MRTAWGNGIIRSSTTYIQVCRQYLHSEATAPRGGSGYVGVYMVYRNNANSIDFYRAMLNVDMTGTAYDYDSEGNLISAEDNAIRNQTYSYSDANELLETVDAKTSGTAIPTHRTTSIS